MAHPVQRKTIKGTEMVLIAGPFETTRTDKDILGRMIWSFIQKGTAFHIEKKARLLFLWRDAEGYISGDTGERQARQGKTPASKGSKTFHPKVWKSMRKEPA